MSTAVCDLREYLLGVPFVGVIKGSEITDWVLRKVSKFSHFKCSRSVETELKLIKTALFFQDTSYYPTQSNRKQRKLENCQ